MKTKIFTVAALLTLLMSPAHAASKSFFGSSEAAPAESSGNGGKRFGLGLSSIGSQGVNATMISGWIPLKSTSGIQLYLGIPNTAGGFNFLAGGAFKTVVAGTSQTGFHIGGDVLLGSIASSFTAIFGGLLGIHYYPASNIMLSLDGGPQLGINNGTADFSIGAVSNILGASVLFFF